ncbi:PREDICTED: uncharacterized protein LOC108769889 [Trachymyrmex cornetzi]|uniref:uncharacterized protein LOC108769889 n=1 Tax=Trachymyrmex cornetzi TaxID=471704 RepID=UPI00084EE474|nr:PREDICTED: uncharacterized protein LOC108769889 [Trachymyrmex cornetzi]
MHFNNSRIFLWSDSTIALHWVSSPSRRWSTFVANRVGEVQPLAEIRDWRHVNSENNPADVLSRGLNPSELIDSNFWWHGPSFLLNDDELWPSGTVPQSKGELPEQKKVASNVIASRNHIIDELLTRFSRLTRITRIVAYCLRFSKAYRPDIPSMLISPAEATRALDIISKIVQEQSFPAEYRALRKKDAITAPSNISSLNPFMDDSGLIRVGGRLGKSSLQRDARHPVLLPSSHALTRLIIEQQHVRNLHAGAQATMAERQAEVLAFISAIRYA